MKVTFDYLLAFILTITLLPFQIIIFILCSIDTKNNGIFTQKRVGKNGKVFLIYKFRTISHHPESPVKIKNHDLISRFGKLIRKYRLDELPQLWNILSGKMSFVGPRPDVEGYADILKGEDRVILTVKPGIFGPAQLKYHNESELLAKQENPVQYNNKVIWPDKVKINKAYIKNWSFLNDLKIIFKTLKLVFLGSFQSKHS